MRRLSWLLPLGIAAALAVLSHRPTYPLGITLPWGLGKVAHALAFGSLAFTLDLALTPQRRRPLYKRHFLVLVVGAVYGATDEWHQAFIPGRDCSFGDWVADVVGTVAGLGMRVVPLIRSRRLRSLGWQRGAPRRADPGRPMVLVADPHWGEEMTGLDAATRANPGADWLFLGDIFDVWVGLPGMERPLHKSFLAWVDAQRAAGAWVGLWLGNRDYFLEGHAARFDLMGEGIGGWLEEGLSFEHGDLVQVADWRYRAWHMVSRSGFAWLFARLLPGVAGARLAVTLERRMRTGNTAYRLKFPETAFAAAAAGVPGTFVTGHFHTHHRVGKGVALPWAHEGRFMVWREGRVEALPDPGFPSTLEPGTDPRS